MPLNKFRNAKLNQGNLDRLNGQLTQLFCATGNGKTAGSPYVVITYCQSNGIVSLPPAEVPKDNPYVKDYRNGENGWGWYEASTSWPRTEMEGDGTVFIGLPGAMMSGPYEGQPASTPSWYACDELQRNTGAPVYHFFFGRNGTRLEEFLDDGIVGSVAVTHIMNALNSIPNWDGKVDAILGIQGESDLLAGFNPRSYADLHKTFRAQAETLGWATPYYSHWLLAETGNNWGRWQGPELVVEDLGSQGTLIPGKDLEEIDVFGWHLTSESGITLGTRLGMGVAAGPLGAKGFQATEKNHMGRAYNERKVDTATPVTILALSNPPNQTVFGTLNLFGRREDRAEYYRGVYSFAFETNGADTIAVNDLALIQGSGDIADPLTQSIFWSFTKFGFLVATPAAETWLWTASADYFVSRDPAEASEFMATHSNVPLE